MMNGECIRSTKSCLANQTRNQLFDNRVRFRLDFLFVLVLDRMGNVDRVEFRPAERGSLGARGGHELMRCDGHRRDPHALQLHSVVQTARCAGASISQTLDHSVGGSNLFDHAGWGRFGKGRLRLANYVRNTIAIL